MEKIAQIEIKVIDNAYCSIHMSGEVDINNLDELEKAVAPMIEKKSIKAFVIDCSNLEFIDSKIVGYIAYLHTTLNHSGRTLTIANTNETINDILTLVGLTTIIPAFESVDEAIQSL